MPTQQPPKAPEIPDFSAGPFQQWLSPPPAQMQVEQAQNQGQQFSGYETGTGKVAGMLSKFLEGASVGRAQADAKKLQQQTLKQQQDINQLNQFMQMSQSADIDPEARQQLQQQALKMQGQWVVKHLEESGKSNPLMKVLHEVGIQMLGGHPADEGTQVDPKTGKKSKTKTTYEGGVDPEKMNALWAQLGSAPKAEQVAVQKSQAMTDEAKALIDKAQASHPNTPVTAEEAKGILATSGLETRGQLLQRTYGVDPIGGYLESFRKTPTGSERLAEARATREETLNKLTEQIFGGGQQQAGPPQPPPAHLDPQALFELSIGADARAPVDDHYVKKTADGKDGKYVQLYETKFGYYDKQGNLVPSELVLSKAEGSARAQNKWEKVNTQDESGNPVVGRYNVDTGETQIAKWPDGRPMRPYFAGTDAGLRAFKNLSKYDDTLARFELDQTKELDALDKEATRKDPDGNPYMTQDQYAARKRTIESRYRDLTAHVKTRFDNQQRSLEADSENKKIPIAAMGSSNVVERNNNPLALKVQKDGVGTFKQYADPQAGIKDASDLLDKYMSPNGLYGVNENSTLEDLMGKWAPYGDGDNDPEVYAGAIARNLGLKGGSATTLKELKSRKRDMMKFMAGWEGGKKFIPEIDKYFGVKPTATAQPPATPYKEFSGADLRGAQ